MLENTESSSDRRYLLDFCLMKRYSRAFLWSFVRVAPNTRCLSCTVLAFFFFFSFSPYSLLSFSPLRDGYQVSRFEKVDGISPPRQTIYIVCAVSFKSVLFLLALSD